MLKGSDYKIQGEHCGFTFRLRDIEKESSFLHGHLYSSFFFFHDARIARREESEKKNEATQMTCVFFWPNFCFTASIVFPSPNHEKKNCDEFCIIVLLQIRGEMFYIRIKVLLPLADDQTQTKKGEGEDKEKKKIG